MGVDLRRRDGRVPEQFLYRPKIGARVEQVSRKSVSQGVCGQARVLIDGVETTNTTGIWQNKSSPGISIPDTILFAWRWPTSGTHTIQILPGIYNAKEGGSFINIQSYLVTP